MLESLTQSPDFYDYVSVAVLFLAVFNAGEILFLLYNKSKVERSERRRLELKRLASTALITATEPAELLPKPSTEDEYAAYSEAIASVLDSFEGEVAAKASGLITQLGIDGHYRRLARDRAWYKRGNAIDILSSFRLKSNREFFLAVFRSETSNDVKYRIIYGLSRLSREHADIEALAHMLSTLPYLTAKYTEDIFYNIISALKAEGKEAEFGLFLKDILHDGTVLNLVKRDCLTACFAASCERGRSLLKEYYAAYPQEPEILIAAVKSLARQGDFSLMPDAMRNPDWRVRLAAIKYAHLCCLHMLPELKEMLKDPGYHVRLNAALALAKGGEKGRAVLKEAAAGEDKYAAAAAAFALTQEAR
ncbi:MAG: HEAT repeat domain-containing protein [Elusimicrobiales bacterium]